jgi:sterol desaturase/sphingolipid hydroxylase (fatty acid hydroxylase superfamily)
MDKYEGAIRIAAFGVMLVLMGLWEVAAPRRPLSASKTVRWFSNITLLAINSLAVKVGFVLGAVGIASGAREQHWGLFNIFAPPRWLEVILSVLLMDLAIYLQHVLFHALPMLWRLHMVHHADPDFDVTTGLRFHTLEIGLSMGIKAAAIVLLGASPLAVLTFEVLLNISSMFSHSNVMMPAWLDAVLRWVVVTPDMHRVHHSVIKEEANSNFGFNVPWWDYLLGTYRAQPKAGHDLMRIGVSQIAPKKAVWLHWLILLPFARTKDTAAADDAGES